MGERSPVRLTLPVSVLVLMGVWGSMWLPGVAGAMGTFSPPHADSGLDVDGDGLFDYLVVEAVLDVTEANEFFLEGVLHDENFTFGIETTNVTTLGMGLHTVPLWFYGPEINGTGVDGPYLVELLLHDNSNLTLLDEDTHSTAAYNHTDFDGFPALLEPPHSDHGLDTDGDGRFNRLVVEVSVNVSDSGTFLIEGFLRNANFSLFLSASNETSLAGGLQTVQLRYPGFAINASLADGPYTVSLQMTDVASSIPLDSDLHTTAAYSHLDFEEPPVIFSPPHSDSGLDTNADGLFDFLAVNATVNVSEADTYIIQGLLRGGNSSLVVGASNSTPLDLGVQTVQLDFPGHLIKEAGVDGPYLVEFSARNVTTFVLLDIGNHTTSSYSHLEFQGPPVQFAPPHTEDPLDLDGNGQIDYLVLNARVEVTVAGTYVVFASISFGSDGLLQVLNLTTLDPGTHTVPLWFYGPGLRNETGGPYVISLLSVDIANATFLDTDAYVTAPYSPQDFDGPERLLSAPATITPAVDGTLAAGEWVDATVVNLTAIPGNMVPALLYVKNDADRLYVAYDVMGDVTENAGDSGSMGFDTGNDDAASDGAEDEFVQRDGSQAHHVYNASLNFWALEDSPYDPSLPNHQGLESGIGFAPSENSPTPHRAYEFAVPIPLLGLPDGEIGFQGMSHPSPGIGDASLLGGFTGWPAFTAGPLPLWGYGDLILADFSPPVLTIDSPVGNTSVLISEVEVRWTASDAGSGVDRFEVSLDAGTPVVLPGSASSYTFAAVAEGLHSVLVTAVDVAGNSRASTVDFFVDTSPPLLSIDFPADGSYVNTSRVEVAWTASDLGTDIDRFEVTLDGGTPEAVAGTSTGHTFANLVDGSHTINVTAVDQAGRSRTVLLGLTVDTVPPTVQVTSPAGNSVLPFREVEVTWEAEDATSGIDHFELRLLGRAPVIVAAGVTAYTFSGLGDGPHSVAVIAIDHAGNAQSQTVGFTVDTNIFSPTGPFGILLLAVIPLAIGGVVVATWFLWIRKRGARGT